MDSLLLYTIKLITLSGIFVGYYWLALRNKRFHYFNRFYLLAALLLSLIIPIIRFDWFTNEKPVFIGSGESIDIIVGSTIPLSNNFGIGDISILFMITTSVLMITLSGYHIYKVYRIKKQSQITPMEGFDLMYTDEESAPFSFLDNLFWKRSISIEDEGGKQIFKHELTHIQQKHTWDRLFIQLCCSIFWMNPFYWIIQKELETIHEFIADEAAVGNQDVESFAKMLIQTHYGNHFFETKHSFFYSSIKRRLTMLTTTTNTRFSYLRRVMLLPLLLTSISIFSVRVHAKEKIESKINAISESIFQKKIDTIKAPPPPPSLNERIRTTKAIVFINGKEANKVELAKSLKPNEVSDIKFFTAEDATKKYGDKGKYGSIEISSKVKSISLNVIDTNIIPPPKTSLLTNQLILIDGKEGTKEEYFTKMLSDNITHINPLDAEKAIIKYGSKGNNGVWEITTKEKSAVVKNDLNDFPAFQEAASFPGGASEWLKYLEHNLNRDKPVIKGAAPGKYTVNLNFIVDKDGDIKDVVAENNPGFSTKDEAIRVMLSSPKWIPAKQNGQPVVSQVKQSITFLVSAE